MQMQMKDVRAGDNIGPQARVAVQGHQQRLEHGVGRLPSSLQARRQTSTEHTARHSSGQITSWQPEVGSPDCSRGCCRRLKLLRRTLLSRCRRSTDRRRPMCEHSQECSQ